MNPRSSFDDELKDALWPLYSRLIVSVINVLYLALSHGSQEAIIAYYTPANRLPARLLVCQSYHTHRHRQILIYLYATINMCVIDALGSMCTSSIK